MSGFYLGNKNTYLDSAKQESGELRLLVKESNLEIMEQYIQKGRKFYVYPGDSDKLMEFFYILEGDIVSDDTKISLNPGDYFYVHKLDKPIFFLAQSDVKMIYMSNEPIFNLVSDKIKNMTNIITKIQEKDQYTKKHSNRVQEYSVAIAKKLGLDRDMLESLNYASLFHDIGKIEVPEDILNKPGKLTKSEFDCIKKHPQSGKSIVGDLYYKNIGKIIEQHHERIDGSGYPHGLKGDEILLEARIIAVVDTYDAMTSDRPYRKGLPTKMAIKELNELSGVSYDSKIVNIFMEVLEDEGVYKRS